jgi:hypothetical protein
MVHNEKNVMTKTLAEDLRKAIKNNTNYFAFIDGDCPDRHLLIISNFAIVTCRIEKNNKFENFGRIVLYFKPEYEEDWAVFPEECTWGKEEHEGMELIVTDFNYEKPFDAEKLSFLITERLDELKKYFDYEGSKNHETEPIKRIIKKE